MDLTVGLPLPKSPQGTRQQQQARAKRAERKVIKVVRAAVFAREYHECRVSATGGVALHDVQSGAVLIDLCDGPVEWAHLHSHRRSQTRGQAPELRHTTGRSLCLCRRHHRLYDAHRLLITALSRLGADGALKLRMAGEAC